LPCGALCFLVAGIISTRTVNLSLIVAVRPDHAKVASTSRRLQRFFLHVRRGDDRSASLVTALIGTPAPRTQALDGTNWKVNRPGFAGGS